MKHIRYRKGYKYQLAETYITKIRIYPPEAIETKYIILRPSGLIAIMEGYAWDGPSGPTLDSSWFMRGSLIHDALAQLIRQKHLGLRYLDPSNRELKRICIEDGMTSFVAHCVYLGVRMAGTTFVSKRRKVISAP